MSWRLDLEGGRKHVQKVRQSFHIFMAAIDLRAPSDEEVAVILSEGDSETVLCSLRRKRHFLQKQVDLTFMRGQEFVISVSGRGRVILTGFFVPAEDHEESEEDEQDEEESQLKSFADMEEEKYQLPSYFMETPRLLKLKAGNFYQVLDS